MFWRQLPEMQHIITWQFTTPWDGVITLSIQALYEVWVLPASWNHKFTPHPLALQLSLGHQQESPNYHKYFRYAIEARRFTVYTVTNLRFEREYQYLQHLTLSVNLFPIPTDCRGQDSCPGWFVMETQKEDSVHQSPRTNSRYTFTEFPIFGSTSNI